jgi:hypothetical protein
MAEGDESIPSLAPKNGGNGKNLEYFLTKSP